MDIYKLFCPSCSFLSLLLTRVMNRYFHRVRMVTFLLVWDFCVWFGFVLFLGVFFQRVC